MNDTAKQDKNGFHSVPEAIEALKRGEIIIVTDDESRENEGDLICAAEKVTPEVINFMAQKGRGLICVAMEQQQVAKLGLARMASVGSDQYGTAFMESVDAKEGISTGISTHDRAHTIKVLIDDNSGPNDLVRPGHCFPLQAVEGGVLRRPGHTEAAVDLARFAGVKPAGVICEVLRDDGQMARYPELLKFAGEHHLKMISVASLLSYRQRNEKLVELEREIEFPTKMGTFTLKLYYSYLDDRCDGGAGKTRYSIGTHSQ